MRAPLSARTPPLSTPPELRLLSHARPRSRTRLDDPWEELELASPSLADLLALADRRRVVIWGGEPTLRADLPELISGLCEPLLRCDGLALGRPGVVDHLGGRGMLGARLPLHSGRRDANDWLLDRPGATRAILAGARAVVRAGLRLEVEVALCRPTTPHLAETVRLAARLGARAVILRRLRRRGPAGDAWVALSPRFGLLEPELEAAARVARQEGLDLRIEGLPRCAAPGIPEAFQPEPRLLTPSSPGWAEAALQLPERPGAIRCPGCPGPPCPGAPDDYTSLFGARDFESERPPAAPSPVPPSLPPGEEAPTLRPPPRAGRSPATRLRELRTQLAAGDLRGDPLPPGPAVPPERVEVSWTEDEERRAVKIRLVRAAEEGAKTLRILGGSGLHHPAAAILLREATRLSAPRLELRGELSGLNALSDDELRRLRRFASAVTVLRGATPEEHDAAVGRPGAFADAMEGLTRLARATRGRVAVAVRAPLPWSGPELPVPPA